MRIFKSFPLWPVSALVMLQLTRRPNGGPWTFVSVTSATRGDEIQYIPDVRDSAETVRVEFIDERHGQPTHGEWYLSRAKFEAVASVHPVPWQVFVESDCHTLTTTAGMLFGVLPRDFEGWVASTKESQDSAQDAVPHKEQATNCEENGSQGDDQNNFPTAVQEVTAVVKSMDYAKMKAGLTTKDLEAMEEFEQELEGMAEFETQVEQHLRKMSKENLVCLIQEGWRSDEYECFEDFVLYYISKR